MLEDSDTRKIQTVAVIVPTFRRPELLDELLASLAKSSRPPDEVIVVDNDPADSARPTPIEGLSVRVVHARLGLNLAGARNVGWQHAASDVCIFIDDDNVVDNGAIAALTDALADPTVGLAAPLIYCGDEGVIWCGGILLSRWTGYCTCILRGASELPSDEAWATDSMPDAFALPRSVLLRTSGFDDRRFPFHYDEADLCMRIRSLGLKMIVIRDASVRHYGWVGMNPSEAMVRATMAHGAERARRMTFSRVLYHRIYSTGVERLTALGVAVPAWALLIALDCLRQRGPLPTRIRTSRAMLRGLWDGYLYQEQPSEARKTPWFRWPSRLPIGRLDSSGSVVGPKVTDRAG